jgi:RNase P protein component
MRENFRNILKNEEYSFLNDYLSIICVAKKGMLEANYNETTKSFNYLLNKKREV